MKNAREGMERNKSAIKVSELRAIIDSILSHVENDLRLDEIELSEDYYWNIPDEALYSVGQNPSELTVGSLCDDLEFLRPLLKDKEQAFSLMLIHVAPLLRYIATKVGQ